MKVLEFYLEASRPTRLNELRKWKMEISYSGYWHRSWRKRLEIDNPIEEVPELDERVHKSLMDKITALLKEYNIENIQEIPRGSLADSNERKVRMDYDIIFRTTFKNAIEIRSKVQHLLDDEEFSIQGWSLDGVHNYYEN